MRDPAKLPDLMARDLAAVDWLAPGQIRGRARRRTIRNVVAAPVAALLVVASVWLLAGPGQGGGLAEDPVGGNGPSASSPPNSPSRPAASLPAGWFGPEILLQPQDVGPGYELGNENAYAPGEYPAWPFAMEQCAAYAGLGVRAFLGYTWMRHNTVARRADTATKGDVHAELRSYAGVTAAKQVVSDAREVVTACREYSYDGGEGSTEERPGKVVHTSTVVDQDFAGDQSLLVRRVTRGVDARTGELLPGNQSVGVELLAVIRVQDRVEVLQTDQDDPDRLRAIAAKAGQRL
jgi:hypothetical protein